MKQITTRTFWIIESRNNKKAWKPDFVWRSEAAARRCLTRLHHFDARWGTTKERRTVETVERPRKNGFVLLID
jgi:hypothetical protein